MEGQTRTISQRQICGTNIMRCKMVRRKLIAALAVISVIILVTDSMALAQQAGGPLLPHVGGRITTSFSNTFGQDAESDIVFTAITNDTLSIGYTSQRGLKVSRDIRRADMRSSAVYVLGFSAKMPKLIEGTTSLGISGFSLEDLRAKGKTPLALIYDETGAKLDGELVLVEKSVKLQLLIENQLVPTAAVRAKGKFGAAPREAVADFYFLDNKNNAMMLQSQIQFSWEKQPRLERIIKVTAGASQQAAMQQSLATLRKYDVYGILFDFGSARIRPETASLITDIAATLKNNPSWRLQVNGHTDSIGGEAANKKLSTERAAAVMSELIRLGTAADRLTSAGLGETAPKADNGTLEGRALNRRVELVRTDN